LRVVSFNVLHDYPRFGDQELRTARLAAALRALAPDVVLLQEAWSTPAHGNLAARLASELGMDSTYVRANGSRHLIGFEEGLAALSRWPIVDARAHSLAPRRHAVERRVALTLEVRVAADETVSFVVTHLTHADPAVRDAQAISLLQVAPSGWHLVAGDFNGTIRSAALAAFVERGYRTLVPGGIDHVLVPTGGEQPWIVDGAAWTLRPNDLRRLIGETVPLSDHPGIVVDLRRQL
jgi:endonuclease/exonuclease/phosphatase family metal-dependent hydrolase